MRRTMVVRAVILAIVAMTRSNDTYIDTNRHV